MPATDSGYDQPDLLDLLAEIQQRDTATVEDDDQPVTLADQFVAFCRRNPGFMPLLEQRVGNWHRSTGGRKVGIEVFLGSIRYDYGVTVKSNHFKVNNSFAAFIVRTLIHKHPEWREMFELRRSVADVDRAWLTAVAA